MAAAEPQIKEPKNSGFVPHDIKSPVITLSAVNVDVSGRYFTIVLGIIVDNFPEEEWSYNVERLKSVFALTDDNSMEMKIYPKESSSRQINDEELAEGIIKATDVLNGKPDDMALRIIRIGPGNSASIYEGIRSLLQGWKQDPKTREIQYVTIGDADTKDNLHFCKWLSLSETCKTIDFVNTTDYTRYGFVDHIHRCSEILKSRKSGKGGIIEALQQMGLV